MDLTRLRAIGAVFDRTALDLRDLRRHADHDARPDPALAFVRLADEVTEHALGCFEVGDHAIAHRLDRGDVGRRSAEHLLRFVADGLYLRIGRVEGEDGRFIWNVARPRR